MEIITKETAQYIADTLGIALKDVFTIYSESIKTLALIDMYILIGSTVLFLVGLVFIWLFLNVKFDFS